jgi:uncharacterized protein YjaZ
MRRTWIASVATVLLIGASQAAAEAPAPTADSAPERVVELDRGCELAMDAKLGPDDPLTRDVERQVRLVVSKVQGLIAANDLTIHIKKSDKSTERFLVPQLGVGGHPIGTDTVWMYIQPENPNFKTEFLSRGLPHEIHHAIRLRNPDWHWSLLESFVMEGLADHFVIEVAGGEPGAWSRALTDEEARRNLARVKPLLRIKIESYTEFVEKYETPWLFGRSGDDPIPRWTGYALGWRIVENYLRAHPDTRASSLVDASADAIAGATPGLE